MINKNIISIFLSFLFISSCTQKIPASIVLKGQFKYDKNSNNQKKYAITETAPKTTVSIKPDQNFVIVASGDNLYKIAQKNNTTVRDLISANNIEPPFALQVGSKIIIPAIKYHMVEEGDNLYKISRKYNMNVNELIKINELQEPYNIVIGSKLKVSGSYKDNDLMATTGKKPHLITDIKLPEKENNFIWPVNGKVISTFGQKPGGLYNDGINIQAKESEPVKAAEDGLVAYVGNELRGYGNLIILKHSGGWISAYAHLKDTKVKIGTKVSKGSPIATVGSSGNVNSAQLYFGIRRGREAVNPQLYLD